MAYGAKIVLFALYCTGATLNPFLSLVLQDNGFNLYETGRLVSISRVLTLCITPVVCFIADRFHCHVPLLATLSLLASLLMLLWHTFVPLCPRGDTAATVQPAVAGPTQALFSPAQTQNMSFAMTATVLGLYAAFGGSKSIITDTLVLRDLQASAAAAAASATSDAASATTTGSAATTVAVGKTASTGNKSSSSSMEPCSHLATSRTTVVPILSETRRLPLEKDVMEEKEEEEAPWSPSGPYSKSTHITDQRPLLSLRGTPASTTAAATAAPATTSSSRAPARRTGAAQSTGAYPLQRLWGSIAYGITAFATGLLVRARGHSPVITENPILWTSNDSLAANGDGNFFGLNTSHVMSSSSTAALHPYRIVPLVHGVFLILFAISVVAVMGTGRRPSPSGGSSRSRAHPSSKGSSAPPSHMAAAAAASHTTPSTAAAAAAAAAAGASVVPNMTAMGVVAVAGSFAGPSPTPTTAATATTATGATATASSAASLRSSYSGVHFTRRVYGRLLRDPRMIFPLGFGMCFLALCEGVAHIFLFPYLRRVFGAPAQLFSCIMLVHMLSEVAAYLISSRVLQVWGKAALFITGALCYAVKMFLYASTTNPWWLLAVESLHGMCISFTVVASLSLVTEVTTEVEQFFTEELRRSFSDEEAALTASRAPVMGTVLLHEDTTRTSMRLMNASPSGGHPPTCVAAAALAAPTTTATAAATATTATAIPADTCGGRLHREDAFSTLTRRVTKATAPESDCHRLYNSSHEAVPVTEEFDAISRVPLTATAAATTAAGTSTTTTTAAAGASASKERPKVEVLSTALGLTWMVTGGIPNVVAGFFPTLAVWLLPDAWQRPTVTPRGATGAPASMNAPTPPVVGEVFHMEVMLFNVLGVLCCGVALLFVVYYRVGLLR